jgi:hypothetical protein
MGETSPEQVAPKSEEQHPLHGSPPNEQLPSWGGLASEFRWITAFGIAVCGLTVYLLTGGTHGSEIANTLALPVAVIGVLVTLRNS